MSGPYYNKLVVLVHQSGVQTDLESLLRAKGYVPTVHICSDLDTKWIADQLDRVDGLDGVVCCVSPQPIRPKWAGEDLSGLLKAKFGWQIEVASRAFRLMPPRPSVITLTGSIRTPDEVADSVADAAIEAFVRATANLHKKTRINFVRPTNARASDMGKLAKAYFEAIEGKTGTDY